AHRAAAVGAAGCSAYPGFRTGHRLAGAADGQDRDRPTVAVCLGDEDAAVKRLVVEHLEPIDGARLDGLYRIGVDEISYKRGHQYLTVVADHDTGRVVWVARERSQDAVQEFLDALGPERAAGVEAVTLDGSSIYAPVLADGLPEARLCLDPFHVTKWVNEALDK